MVMTPLAIKAKRKGVSRLIAKGSAHPKVSPSRSAAKGDT